MLLDRLVTTLQAVAATRSRLAKVDALAILLRDLETEEVRPAVGFIVGRPRQGRVGIGWRTVRAALDGDGAAAPAAAESEPAPSEPAPSEPAPSEPAPSEPAPSELAPGEPAPVLAATVVEPPALASAPLTVEDMDALLDTLAAASGTGSATTRTTALRAFADRATAEERDFVARVLLGEMRTGALEGRNAHR